ncbi:hypothetical protein CDD82_3087 [Ophiocordyceps australis]|uniref:Uncharacterized protein n=1 Tax=Ophiocordyceps australis TaxID=1399860 RepID=A0A2C5YJV1_9HYPO|nr:hypothetical protein CDD82_3087 [Ophiocordyceps australis]
MASRSSVKFDSRLIKAVLRLATRGVQQHVSDATHDTILCFWPGPRWRGKCWCGEQSAKHSWQTCNNVFARLPGRQGSRLQKCTHEEDELEFDEEEEFEQAGELLREQEARHELCFSVGEMVAWYFEDFLARRSAEGLPAVQELATGIDKAMERYRDYEDNEDREFYDALEETIYEDDEEALHSTVDVEIETREQEKKEGRRYWTLYQFCVEMACAIDTSKTVAEHQTHGLQARHILGLVLGWQGREAEFYTNLLGKALTEADQEVGVVRRTLLGELAEGRLAGSFQPEAKPWRASELGQGNMPRHF